MSIHLHGAVTMKNPIAVLRATALIEGGSFLVLLFLAMPLKYIWDQPMAVRVVGGAHGALWVVFCAMLLYTTVVAKWPLGRAALLFVAALIPFGPWLVDRRMKQYEAEYFQLRDGRSVAQNGRLAEIPLDKPAPKV